MDILDVDGPSSACCVLGDVEIVDVEGPSPGCGVSGDAEALLEGVEQ